MSNELALIVNPRAGRRTAVWSESALRALFEPLGFGVSVHATRAAGDARRIAREVAPRATVIAAVGGDGTIHETVNGLLPLRTPVVIVPSGAGNDLSSLIACPRTPRELAEVVGEGWGAELDVISIGDRFCVNSVGIGFEGLVNRLSHGVARVGGRTRYAIALLRALPLIRCARLTITTSRGDVIAGEMLLVSIGNGRRTGGAFYLTPDAFPDDGLIDVCAVASMSRAKMLFMLPRSLNGTHVKRPEVRMLRSESLVIEAESPYPMHIDGEYLEGAPGRREVAVVPGAIRVLCRRSGASTLSKGLKRIL
ncbi:MAG: lipid kinase, YegS/Rv2252/BmrU family [Candidatus Krumholzibacteriota bacterium]|nr:lipid kinase, YegS/Rv2252/BmrU family [Candidatus Krumholzibacteriota bacterium]